jgi:hypothetical protein
MNERERQLSQIASSLGVLWHPGEAVVALEEEYGYRSWFWFTGISASALEEWWRTLPSVSPYFMNPTEPESGAPSLPGHLVKYDQELSASWASFSSLADFTGHLHQDDDSFLSKKVFIHHAGHCSR